MTHDIDVSIERMTSDECRNLTINYSFAESPFGEILIASTDKGICCLEFVSCREKSLKRLNSKFSNAYLYNKTDDFQKNALRIFYNDTAEIKKINLHIKGTDFQVKVWNSLLNIPIGSTTTYAEIAKDIHHDKAFRAVGTAVGNNPVAIIIPCHRVIKSSGELGNYHWGTKIKAALLDWEKNKIL